MLDYRDNFFSLYIAYLIIQSLKIVARIDLEESLSPAAIIYDEKLASARQLYPSQFAKTDSHLARAVGNPRTDYAKRSNVTITIRWKCSGMLAGSRARRSHSLLPAFHPPPFLGKLWTPREAGGEGDFRFGSARSFAHSGLFLAGLQKTRGKRKLRLASESITWYLPNARPTRARSKRFVRCGDSFQICDVARRQNVPFLIAPHLASGRFINALRTRRTIVLALSATDCLSHTIYRFKNSMRD